MLNRMNAVIVAFLPAKPFAGAIGDDFVDVHIRRRACSALQRVHRKLVVKPPFNHILTRLFNRVGAAAVEIAEFRVRPAAGEFHHRERVNQFRRHRRSADREIRLRPRRVNSPVGVRWNREFPEKVFFKPGCGHHSNFLTQTAQMPQKTQA